VLVAGRLVLVVVLLALLAPPVPADASAMPEAPNCPIYPADDVWHSNIQQMPVNPMSATWIANMGGPGRLLHPDFGGPYGYQLQVVDGATPTTRVAFDYADESDDVPYPFTASTPIEPASDAHAFMLNRESCLLYELFAASWNGGRPTAGSGAVFDLKRHDLRPSGWTSADAAGLPIWPGVLRYDEVARGLVDHAIRFTAQRTDRSFVWPARHQAGAASDASLPPMGARFRLRSDFNVAGYSAQTRVVLTAMQRYGLILADNGSNFYFQGQVDSRWSDQLISELKRVPAGAFEAVDASSLMLDPNSGRVPAAATNQGLLAGWHSTWQQQSPYLVMSPGQVAGFWIRFSNSGTETKWYSRPSASVGRRLRVVCEIDRRSDGSLASSAFTSEVLPAPEGAAMTNSLPGFRGREATLHRAEGPRSWCGNIALLPEHRDELAQRLSAVAHGVLLRRVELGGRAGAPLGNEHRVVAEAAEAAW